MDRPPQRHEPRFLKPFGERRVCCDRITRASWRSLRPLLCPRCQNELRIVIPAVIALLRPEKPPAGLPKFPCGLKRGFILCHDAPRPIPRFR